jgi:hypothetical protein
MWVLIALALACLVIAFLPVIPGLHRLPPPLGATKPPPVTFRVQGKPDMTLQADSIGPQEFVFEVGFVMEAYRDPISPVYVNAWVDECEYITRCNQDGSPHRESGQMMRADGWYWSDTVELRPGSYLLYFKTRVPEPGEYRVVLLIRSPAFYEKKDIPYEDTLRIRPPAPEAPSAAHGAEPI